jgi:hypothetical protein
MATIPLSSDVEAPRTPASVYVVGVLECIGSVLTLLAAAGMAFAAVALPVKMQGRPDFPAGFPRIMMVEAAVMACLAVLGFTTGICLMMRKEWARWSTLIFSGFSILVSAIMTLAFLIAPVPEESGHGARGVMHALAIVALLHAAMFGWWLWLFTRSRMVLLFRGTGRVEASRRPVSITIIGWLWLIGGAMMCVMFGYPMALGTWILLGWKAATLRLLWGGVTLVLGWGLLKLHEWARKLGIILMVAGAVNGAVMWLMPGAPGRFQTMMEASPYHYGPTPSMVMFGGTGSFLLFCLVMMVIAMAVPMYFLITRRSAFEPAGEASGGITLPGAEGEE